MTTWTELLTKTLKHYNETLSDVIACTLSETEMNEEFDDGFGLYEGKPFTAWTTNRVYFPEGYDGAEDVASVPRNPCDESTNHVGGGG